MLREAHHQGRWARDAGQQQQSQETLWDSRLGDAGLNVRAIDLDDWPGFAWEIDSQDKLWLHAQECGNVGHVGEFVRALLARFRPADCWHLTWSETCSKPRVGEFGGGGLFVTSRSVRACGARDWVQRQGNSFDRRRTR